MKYKASELVRQALNFAQINESQALSYENKIQVLNSVFADLWDDVLSHQDDFQRREITINSGDKLPNNLYSIQGVRKHSGPMDRARAGEDVGTDTYLIVNDYFYTRASNCILTYTVAPPNITFPMEPLEISKGDIKTNGRVIVQLTDNEFTITDLLKNTTRTEYVDSSLAVVKWDIWLNSPVAIVNDIANNALELLYDGVVLELTNDFIVNGEFLDTINHRYDSALDSVTQDVFGHYVNGEYFRLNNNVLEVYRGEWVPVEGEVQEIISANPYLLIKQENKWRDFFSDVSFPSGIINGNYCDETGWGFIARKGATYFLHSFYPDTELDWPNNAYYSVMISAMAIKFRRQVEMDVSQYLEEYENARAIFANQLERNRGDAYRIANPYGKKVVW